MQQISMFDGSKPLKITNSIRLIELFAGIGSQSKALENLGADFEHYRVCEFDKYAVKSYNAVHGTNFTTSDIRDLHAEDLGIVDTDKYTYIMTYSFPCTDLSLAGKQEGMKKGSGTRSGLLWEVERLLTELRDRGGQMPQILLCENVPAIHGAANKDDFDDWCNFLLSLGYNNKWQDLNAKDYGIPQNRDRTFMVSWLGDYYYDFPEPKKLKLRLLDMLEEKVAEKFYIKESGKGKKTSSGLFSIYGGKWDNANEMHRRVYSIEGCCPTLTANAGGNSEKKVAIEIKDTRNVKCGIWTYKGKCYIVRKIIPIEEWRIMGFLDKDFHNAANVNSNTRLRMQAGNSIVVNVLMEIFGRML